MSSVPNAVRINQWRPLVRIAAGQPLVLLALSSALAAALAWLAVLPLGGVADVHPYYAPLGAVIAVSVTVVGGIRDAAQTEAGIILGATLGAGVLQLGLPGVAGLAIVVGVGTLLGGTRLLGTQGSWVVYSAIFLLIVSGGNPLDYFIAYVGLTSLGALVGIGVNLLIPPLPLSKSDRALQRLREAIAGELDQLVDGLRGDYPLTAQEWAQQQHGMGPARAHMMTTVQQATQARRANWRARRVDRQASHQYRLSLALQHLFFLVEHLTGILESDETADTELPALGPALRPPTANLLEGLAAYLRVAGLDAETEERRLALGRAETALEELIRAVDSQRWERPTEGFFAVGAVITVVRRALAELQAKSEPTDDSPRSSLPSY